MTLRSDTIRLAAQNPALRTALLAMLTARFRPPGAGTGGENDHIRWHVSSSSVRVTDLTFAGKRGKRCSELAVYDLDYITDVPTQQAVWVFINGLKQGDFKKTLAAAHDLVQLSQEAGGGMSAKLQLSEEMGVRVAPAGFKPFKANWEFVSVDADLNTFGINDKVDMNNLPACMPAIKGGKDSIKVFYRWVQDNERKLKGMKFYEILGEMSDAGIKYHNFCRMD